MRTRILLLTIIMATSLVGCRMWGVRGNGNVNEEVRKVANFNKIYIGGAFSVKIRIAEKYSLKISAEENLLGLIRTRVRGDILDIDTKKTLSPRKEVSIYITTPDLKYINCSGANNVYAEGINSEYFEVNLSGAGNVDLAGKTKKFKAVISGAGSLDAKQLKAEETKIKVSGAASADVFASKNIDAEVSGVGSIDYFGKPEKIRTNISGVGSINQK
ncbi:MAG: head GIN domain-containing protein [Melioribacteraceae bacterium]